MLGVVPLHTVVTALPGRRLDDLMKRDVITIAPEARGKALSAWVLRKASEAAEAAGLTTLRAEIKGDNTKSLNAFKRAGYHGFVAHDDAKRGKYWTCERRVTRFPA